MNEVESAPPSEARANDTSELLKPEEYTQLALAELEEAESLSTSASNVEHTARHYSAAGAYASLALLAQFRTIEMQMIKPETHK